MKPLRIVLLLLLALIVLGGLFVWWSKPRNVDMAAYVPGDTVVYLEFNSLPKLANSIQESDTWKAIAPSMGLPTTGTGGLESFLAHAGLAPAEAVIFSRAQFAVSVVGVDQIEDEDTLRVRPEVALVIETHTSSWRVKPVIRKTIQQLATFAYTKPTCADRDGSINLIECTETGGNRRLLAAVDGSVAVIGNDEKAVQSCLDARHGARPSLQTNAEMLRVRSKVVGPTSVAFGYISAISSARLFAWAAPLMIGKPGDQQLSELLQKSASKILGGIAWTATPAAGGIEDRFVIALDDAVASRLQPAFDANPVAENFWRVIPTSFQAATIYKSKEPLTAWSALNQAAALKLDAVSAVLFGALLKSSLAVYGISNPSTLLPTLKPPLITVTPTKTAGGSVLIARVGDVTSLRRSITEQGKEISDQVLDGPQAQLDDAKEFATVLFDDFVVLGKTENVKEYLSALRSGFVQGENLQRVNHFLPNSTAAIVSFANDEQRVQNFLAVIGSFKKGETVKIGFEEMQNHPRYWNFSATESSLTDNGIERETRSAFGQFSSLLSLIKQDVSPAHP